MNRDRKMVLQLLLLLWWLSAVTGSDVIGTYGNSVTIDCNLPPSDNLVWDSTDGNVIAIKGRFVESNSTKYAIERQRGVRESLVIHLLTLADDKVYRCYDLRRTDVKHLSTVTVLVRPKYVNMTSPTGPVNEGTEVTLRCFADGGKPLPDIRWYMIDAAGDVTEMIGRTRDVIYSNGTGQRTNALVFNVSKEHYNSTLVCNVTVSVFYEETFSTNLDVQLLPQPPTISGFAGIYDENETVHVACTTRGSKPTANIMWLMNGMPIGDFEVVVIPESDGTSTVTSYFRRRLSRETNGSVLTCAVTNNVLVDLNLDSLITNVTLLLSYRPNITVVNNDVITATSGDFVTFRFSVASRPTSHSLALMHNGIVVVKSQYKIEHPVNTSRYDIILSRVSRSYAGNYTFSATNRLGTTSSAVTELKIIYVPECVSSSVQKQAMHVNNSIHLLCKMVASPSDVTMTWKYRHTRTVISMTTGAKDNSSSEWVFGNIDFDARSLLQYTDTFIECYGQNSVGMSSEPCIFQIVHPGPPEAPSNCTVNSSYFAINFMCQPSYDGGSTQAFSLQKLVAARYLTVANRSTSNFNLRALALFGNVTVRMCSVNQEFPDQFSCSLPFEVAIDGVMSEPTKAEPVNTAAFIAGGLVAFIGLLCISAIVIFILRKKQKNIKANTQASETHGINALQMRQRFMDIILRKKASSKRTLSPTSVLQNPSYENTAQNKQNEIQEVNVISSTPCSTKTTKTSRTPDDAEEIFKKFDLKTHKAPTINRVVSIDLVNANGVILSPIQKHIGNEPISNKAEAFETNDALEQDGEYSDSVKSNKNHQTLDNSYTKYVANDVVSDQTLDIRYSKDDIADVLDRRDFLEQSQTQEENESDIIAFTTDPELQVNGMLSLNIDYSNADIVSVLNKLDVTETTYRKPIRAKSHSRENSISKDDHVRTSDDQTCYSLVSEFDTNTWSSHSWNVSCKDDKTDINMTKSFSSPDLSRQNVKSNVLSVSCSSLCNVFEGTMSYRSLPDIIKIQADETHFDNKRIDKRRGFRSAKNYTDVIYDNATESDGEEENAIIESKVLHYQPSHEDHLSVIHDDILATINDIESGHFDTKTDNNRNDNVIGMHNTNIQDETEYSEENFVNYEFQSEPSKVSELSLTDNLSDTGMVSDDSIAYF